MIGELMHGTLIGPGQPPRTRQMSKVHIARALWRLGDGASFYMRNSHLTATLQPNGSLRWVMAEANTRRLGYAGDIDLGETEVLIDMEMGQ